mmetsp:Transcript_28125/g.41540  ORF Transcript_28125/g.41540 Transcript_28125/m.41540 type:complete len:97 (-) Transcript_28125:200-490(-)
MTSSSFEHFDHGNVLLEPIHEQHNKENNDIPPPRKLRRVSTGETYNRIRSDEIKRRKTHRRSPCVLVGWHASKQVTSEHRDDDDTIGKQDQLKLKM